MLNNIIGRSVQNIGQGVYMNICFIFFYVLYNVK